MNNETNQLDTNAALPTSETNRKKKNDSENSFFNALLEVVKTVVFVILFVVCFKLFLVQPFRVIGTSMVPTFHDGEYIFINEVSYRFWEPSRGDVIVFRHPDTYCTPYVEDNLLWKGIFEGPCKTFIKRIIGLPGETVEIKDGIIKIYNEATPDGMVLEESYIEDNIKTLGNIKTKVGENQYFVLGDNRNPNASSDSREWGVLGKEFIVGKAWVRLLPFKDFRVFTTTDY